MTDRDIDKLTEEFLRSWVKENDESSNSSGSGGGGGESDMVPIKASTSGGGDSSSVSSICNHLIRARRACKLTYLNGSAPIVYGLPVKFK